MEGTWPDIIIRHASIDRETLLNHSSFSPHYMNLQHLVPSPPLETLYSPFGLEGETKSLKFWPWGQTSLHSVHTSHLWDLITVPTNWPAAGVDSFKVMV